MKIRLICFTSSGAEVCGRMVELLARMGHVCQGYKKGTFQGGESFSVVDGSLREWTEESFSSQDALIFVGAVGIAVRAIAPFVKSKTSDPACIAVDEQGNYVIPLLSGHIGGANELAEELAQGLGALAVITTATDLNGLFAVDQWARENSMRICDMGLAKQMSADLLEGKTIGYFTSFPIQGTPPKELAEGPGSGTELEISIAASPRSRKALQLIPRCVVLGIGCRKGTSAEAIEWMVQEVLRDGGISPYAMCAVASIDLKAQEKGLLEFCETWRLPFEVYSARELEAVSGDFSVSEFVSSITGVDNVCERAAVLASGNGRLIVKKHAGNGVTVAAAVREPELVWPEGR